MRYLTAIILFGLHLKGSWAFNVLILHPVFCGSHEMLLRSLGERLVHHGHNVTQIRWLSDQSEPVTSSVEVISRTVNSTLFPSSYFDEHGVFRIPTHIMWGRGRGFYRVPTDVYSMFHAHCHSMLADPSLFRQLRAARFHVAIVDLISNECGVALAAALKLPVIGYWGFSFVGGESHFTAATNFPSVTAQTLTDLKPEMNFVGRLYNTFCALAHKLLMSRQMAVADTYIQKYHPNLPDAASLMRNVDVILIFANFFATQPALLPPNIHMVGCIQCREAEPLPQDLEMFMESSGDHGVVLFSLGITGYDAMAIPDQYITSFLKAFGRLKQKVIMRFSEERLSSMSVPRNVLVVPWMPQIDLLGHPKTKAFVSHCGMKGIMESLYHRVPILGVPIFGDQGDNSAFLDYRGLGKGLDKFGLNDDVIVDSLNQLIYNQSIRDNVGRVSEMWRMETETGLQRVLYWINLTARYAPLTHLQMIDRHLSWYQFWMLDVICTMLIIVLSALWICAKLLRFCVNKCRSTMHLTSGQSVKDKMS